MLLATVLVLLGACVTVPSPAERRIRADALAADRSWRPVPLTASGFPMLAYAPDAPTSAAILTVYMEGDGAAWASPDQASDDPTPVDPIGLRLALAHPDRAVAYLGRPCQYLETDASRCTDRYWTEMRYAPEVIDAVDAAVESMKSRFQAQRLILVGYSGGGTVAALVAARRTDVDQLVTVAANLDHARWTALHHVTPLAGSLNAADFADRLRTIPQWHFVGGRDRVVEPAVARSYAGRFAADEQPVIIVEPVYDHRCCWVENWPRLWREGPGLSKSP